jgi:hypothetical protein
VAAGGGRTAINSTGQAEIEFAVKDGVSIPVFPIMFDERRHVDFEAARSTNIQVERRQQCE